MYKDYPIYSSRRHKGFTFIEAIIVTAIGLVAITGLTRFIAAGYPIQRQTFLQINANETARIQLKRIAREMREVRPAETGAYPLVEMQPQSITFYADVDSDDRVERVRYTLNGTDLERGVIEPSGDPVVYDVGNEEVNIVARSIRNGGDSIFTYYGGNYPSDPTPLSPIDLTEVKYIQFMLRIDPDLNQDPDAVEIRSQVQLRNLKTNLGEAG